MRSRSIYHNNLDEQDGAEALAGGVAQFPAAGVLAGDVGRGHFDADEGIGGGQGGEDGVFELGGHGCAFEEDEAVVGGEGARAGVADDPLFVERVAGVDLCQVGDGLVGDELGIVDAGGGGGQAEGRRREGRGDVGRGGRAGLVGGVGG